MRDARAQVTRGIDRVPCRTAQRQPDAPHETADEIGAESGRRTGGGDALREDRADHKDEHERADDLAHQVGNELADGRRGAETRTLERRVRCNAPVWQIVQPHQRAARERAEQLSHEIGSDLGEVTGTGGKSESDRGIQMRVARPAGNRGKDARHHRKRPSGGDHDPATPLGLGALQQHAGHDTVPEQDEDHGAEELSQQWRRHGLPFLSARGPSATSNAPAMNRITTTAAKARIRGLTPESSSSPTQTMNRGTSSNNRSSPRFASAMTAEVRYAEA